MKTSSPHLVKGDDDDPMSYASLPNCPEPLHPGGLALTQRAFFRIRLPEKARVLDIGCGDGATVSYLNASFGLRAVGLDKQPRVPLSSNPFVDPVPVLQALAEHLPVARCCLDAVVAECVLSLMREPLVVLEEIGRVLTPAGKLIMSDVYLRSELDSLPGHGLRCDKYLTQLWTKPEWQRALAKRGLRIIKWEDNTRALQVFAAQAILSDRPLDPTVLPVALGDNSCGGLRERSLRVNLGYFMAIAVKTRD